MNTLFGFLLFIGFVGILVWATSAPKPPVAPLGTGVDDFFAEYSPDCGCSWCRNKRGELGSVDEPNSADLEAYNKD